MHSVSFWVLSICDEAISRGPLHRSELFPEKEGRHASFAQGNLALSGVTAAMQSSTVTAPWTTECYICTILILFKDSKAEQKC